MARHLMAVCVVCLLCAEHLPCKEHIDPSNKLINSLGLLKTDGSDIKSNFKTDVLSTSFSDRTNYVYESKKEKTKTDLKRVKRHDSHSHSHHDEHHHFHDLSELTRVYIDKIFEIYGLPGERKMNVLGFEKILDKLDLQFLKTEVNDSTPKGCVRGLEFVEKVTTEKSEKLNKYKEIMGWESVHHDHPHDHEEHHENSHNEGDEHDHEHEQKQQKSLEKRNAINLTQLLLEVKKSLFLEPSDIKAITPILLYHFLTNRTSLEHEGCINETLFNAENHEDVESRTLVWTYSTLAVIGVSLCGLFGVAVIPIMEKHFYHHVIQFLVALAVGTLCGDALLHLIPHAMMTSTEADDMHESMMYKGLAAVFGIVVFYFFERFLTMVTEWRQKKVKRDKPSSRVRVMRDPENAPSANNGTSGEKLCMHKYSSYPYCYDEIAMDITKDDHHEHNHVDKSPDNIADLAQNLLTKPANGTAKVDVGTFNKNNSFNSDIDNNTVSTNLDDGSIEGTMGNNNQLSNNAAITKPLMPEENYTIILREHESKHHGHSHTHGHVHSPPRSLSAVVWMVIMGDGLHNFTDGMAIGAAFSNNIAGGLSTAVAVFCHELPHELGDFAVLLKAGMSAKEAVYYNILSSILSFFGMVAGILIGDTPEASSWVFSVAAGLFIYIALVDMMPELTSSHSRDEHCMLFQYFLQFLGMAAGFGTMWLIALYEHDLKQMFTQ